MTQRKAPASHVAAISLAQVGAAIDNISRALLFGGDHRLILCNNRYVEMYRLAPDRVRPGTSLTEIVDLRYEAGTVPAMSRDQYLAWRGNIAISSEPSDTTIALRTGEVFRIRHIPMPDGGWVANPAAADGYET